MRAVRRVGLVEPHCRFQYFVGVAATTAMPYRRNLKNRVGGTAAWRQRLTEFGAEGRRLRKRLGLSQEDVARTAGVSQGAVSRFEQGRGVAIPFVGLLKIHLVLARAVKRLDPKLRTDEMEQILRRLDVLHVADDPRLPAWPVRETTDDFDLSSDEHLARVIRDWSDLPERKRRAFVAVIEAVVGTIKEA